MSEISTHDRFLHGEPVNPELEAMRNGREADQTDAKPANVGTTTRDTERPLTRPERLELKELIEMPGWGIYQRLLEKTTLVHQKYAIAKSQDDPLENREEIATAWAYLKMFRRAHHEMVEVANAEVKQLENEQ